jgi:hypothetical protein
MDSSRLLRSAPVVLGLAVLVVAAVLGGAVLAGPTAPPMPSGTSTPASSPTAQPLPAADVPGMDLDRLPRYPGSVRTGYRVHVDDAFQLTALEYLADATVDEVRLYYQGVMDAQGWERADVQYAHDEWSYVLVDGRTEALIEIEPERGLVEIDLQISEPRAASPTPTTSPEPTTEPTARPTALPASPVPVRTPTDDDDGDDEDDETDDDGATDD